MTQFTNQPKLNIMRTLIFNFLLVFFISTYSIIAVSQNLEISGGGIILLPEDAVVTGSLAIGTTPVSIYVSGNYAYITDFG